MNSFPLLPIKRQKSALLPAPIPLDPECATIITWMKLHNNCFGDRADRSICGLLGCYRDNGNKQRITPTWPLPNSGVQDKVLLRLPCMYNGQHRLCIPGSPQDTSERSHVQPCFCVFAVFTLDIASAQQTRRNMFVLVTFGPRRPNACQK